MISNCTTHRHGYRNYHGRSPVNWNPSCAYTWRATDADIWIDATALSLSHFDPVAKRCTQAVGSPRRANAMSWPALPGLVTHGDTIEEARAHAVEAIELYLERLKAEGSPIPIGEDHLREMRREPTTVKFSYAL